MIETFGPIHVAAICEAEGEPINWRLWGEGAGAAEPVRVAGEENVPDPARSIGDGWDGFGRLVTASGSPARHKPVTCCPS